MLTLYITNKNYSSWSLRPWLLMRALGVPFQEKLIPYGETGAFRAASPSGRMPCLADGDIAVWDSLAIVEYLAEKFPGVWPADARARAWARSAAAEMHSGFTSMRSICAMNCGLRIRMERQPPALLADIARLDELWNDGLSRFGGPCLGGKTFTAVDAFFAPVAFRIQTYGLELSAPALHYASRLLALPAMQEWHAAALGEALRREDYEKQAMQAGTLLADLRPAPSRA
ncbi:MAG TPA: glutathione S-transferase family protein [Gallionellaceae bacterium]